MATAARVGRGPCPFCREPVTFKKSSGALLNFKCDACFSSGYAEPGGTTHDAWAKTIKPFAPEAAPPGPAPTGGDPAPPAKPKSFLDQL